MKSTKFYKTTIAVLAVLVVGLGGYIAFSKYQKGELYTKGEDQTMNALSAEGVPKTVPSENTGSGITKTNEDISATLTNDEAISQCVATTKKEAVDKGTKYQKGSLLVSFQSSVTFAQALAVVKSYKFDSADKTEEDSLFKSYHALTVSIPAGQEFLSLCTLRQDGKVKNAILNTTFQIHD